MSKKRSADGELTKDNFASADIESNPDGPIPQASDDVLQTRRIVKARKGRPLVETQPPIEETQQPPAAPADSTISWPTFQTGPASTPQASSADGSISSSASSQPEGTPESAASSTASAPVFSFNPVPATPASSEVSWPTFSFSSPAAKTETADSTPSWGAFGDAMKPPTFSFVPSPVDPSKLPTFSFDAALLGEFGSKRSEPESPTKSDANSSSLGVGVWGVNIAPPATDSEAPAEEVIDDSGKPSVTLEKQETVLTGEEGETTLTSLYQFRENQWKERGVGPLKINKNEENSGRLIMRMEGVPRLLLNAPITSFCTVDKTADKSLKVSCINYATEGDETVRLSTYALRFGKAADCEDVLKSFQTCLDAAKSSSGDATAGVSEPASASDKKSEAPDDSKPSGNEVSATAGADSGEVADGSSSTNIADSTA